MRIINTLLVMLATVFLVSSYACRGADERARCAMEHGRLLGEAIVESSRIMANAGVGYLEYENGSLTTNSEEERIALEKSMKTVMSAIDKLDDAFMDEKLSDVAPYDESHDKYMFEVLRNSLDSEPAFVRMHVLHRAWWICTNGSILTFHGVDECKSELEIMCIRTLMKDSEPENQLSACKIMLDGYATNKSLEAIDHLIKTTDDEQIMALANEVKTSILEKPVE